MVVYYSSHLQCNQEGHHFITSGLLTLKSSVLREVSVCPRGPKTVFVPPCKIILGGPDYKYYQQIFSFYLFKFNILAQQ